MKGRMHHKGHKGHHSPKGHHDIHHEHEHAHHSLGHTAKALGHKHGGHVGGKKAKHHAGKYARGGKMTPSSPLSGADTKPLNFEHNSIPKEDTGGKGRDRGR